MNENHRKTRVAVTMGDPAGIGPEIIVRSCLELLPRAAQELELLVVGRPQVISRAVETLEMGDAWQAISSHVEVLEVGSAAADAVQPGEVSADGGQLAFDALKASTRLALDGAVDAIVTAPLHKEALHAAGINVPGHTELLAEFCNVEQVAMMLHLPANQQAQNFCLGEIGLSVAHVTLHTALRNVFAQLTTEAVLEKIKLVESFCKLLLQARDIERLPKIAVAALNPHGGENGLFGDEETRVIRPAIDQAIEWGWNVTGPEPCDTLMRRAALGEFDAVVAMYHDQGHIALKLLDMFATVNITLGLPIIRTSVAHGTANEIAWKGEASCQSLNQAILIAQQLALSKTSV